MDNREFAAQFGRKQKGLKKTETMDKIFAWLEQTGFNDFDLDITQDWFRIFTGKKKEK